MEFEEKIYDVAARSKVAINAALTEEATKTSVIMPLIRALGFDVFDLNEVIPEFVSDVGTRKGEKVDFAIKIDGRISILGEAKSISTNLSSVQFNQLYRYFSVTEARLAILTNGIDIWFFSDIDAPNKMDKKPFFKFNLQNYSDDDLKSLSKFQKQSFDIEDIIDTASTLKYINKAASYIREQMDDPDDDFIKLVGKNIHDGSLTKSVVEQLRPAISSALDAIIRDRIQDRLGVTFRPQPSTSETSDDDDHSADRKDVETTEEEMQAFMIVRAIAAKSIDINRITIRDAKTYCSVFVDDNNRKPVCRFHFNAKSVKYLGVFDESKDEIRHEIISVSDIYRHAQEIERAISPYL